MSMSLPAAPLLYEQGSQAAIALASLKLPIHVVDAFSKPDVFKTYSPKSFEIIRTVSLTALTLALTACTSRIFGARGQKIIAGFALFASCARICLIFTRASRDPLMCALTQIVGGEKATLDTLPKWPFESIRNPRDKTKALVDRIRAIEAQSLTDLIHITETPDGRRVVIMNVSVPKGTIDHCQQREASDKMVVAFVENFNYWDLPSNERSFSELLKHIFGFKSINEHCSFNFTVDNNTTNNHYHDSLGHSVIFYDVDADLVKKRLDFKYNYTCLISGSLSSETSNLLATQYASSKVRA